MPLTKNNALCELLGFEKSVESKKMCDCGEDIYHCISCPRIHYETVYNYPNLRYKENYSFDKLSHYLVLKFGCLKISYTCGEYIIHMGNPEIQGKDKSREEALYEFICNLLIYNQLNVKEVTWKII